MQHISAHLFWFVGNNYPTYHFTIQYFTQGYKFQTNRLDYFPE